MRQLLNHLLYSNSRPLNSPAQSRLIHVNHNLIRHLHTQTWFTSQSNNDMLNEAHKTYDSDFPWRLSEPLPSHGRLLGAEMLDFPSISPPIRDETLRMLTMHKTLSSTKLSQTSIYHLSIIFVLPFLSNASPLAPSLTYRRTTYVPLSFLPFLLINLAFTEITQTLTTGKQNSPPLRYLRQAILSHFQSQTTRQVMRCKVRSRPDTLSPRSPHFLALLIFLSR